MWPADSRSYCGQGCSFGIKAKPISDRIGVMYLGKLVEVADTQALFADLRHAYTRALLAASPTLEVGGGRAEHAMVEGEQPSARNPPSGCRFHPRCPVCFDPCPHDEPALVTLEPGRRVACHLAGRQFAEPGRERLVG